MGDEVKLYIRPENVQIASTQERSSSMIEYHKAEISQLNYLGTSWEIAVSLFGESVQILTNSYDPSWQYGSEVYIKWNLSDIMLIKK